ncbi:DUF421 domain-containing protein [Paenibacillus sp. MBLB4367]|uniref:DUF421 domain-containing protein n=1 Tax=Paenibacillus sp. MBLB4367 TaxID=3384767 RepID=UPI003908016F
MEVWSLFFRTLLTYFIVFMVMRLMGKREIGKLSVFDLVIFIMIAEIAVFVIEDVHKPLTYGIVPILTLMLTQIGLAILALRSQWIRSMFDGKPSFLIKNGQLDRDEMKRQRYNLDDLMQQLRQNRVVNVADVEFAILEPSGKLTVLEKKGKAEEARSEFQDTMRLEGLPLPLIMDGKVQDESLSKLGQTRFWLKNQLQTKGVNDFKEVFFCSIDHRGKLFVDKKKK